MRVLIAHTCYVASSPSGENVTVKGIASAAAKQDVEVCEFLPSSDSWRCLGRTGQATVAAGLVVPIDGALSQAVRDVRPDVVQVHNPVPFIGPGELSRINKRTPVVHVVHNYRHTCLNGSHFRDGAGCRLCRESSFGRAQGVRLSCYRNDRAQSAVLATSETIWSGAWRNLAGYVAISDFIRNYLVESGFPPERVRSIPNPATAPEEKRQSAGGGVLCAGRLAPEKGVIALIEAWKMLPSRLIRGRSLHLAGDGPSRGAVEKAAAPCSNVVVHGRLSQRELQELGESCLLTVVPSVWDEPFGRTVIEAFAAGRGVVVTNRGGLPELASDSRCSWMSEATSDGLAQALGDALAGNPDHIRDAALENWSKRFSPDVVGVRYAEFWRELAQERYAMGR